jgi:hypothetical protein
VIVSRRDRAAVWAIGVNAEGIIVYDFQFSVIVHFNYSAALRAFSDRTDRATVCVAPTDGCRQSLRQTAVVSRSDRRLSSVSPTDGCRQSLRQTVVVGRSDRRLS